MTSALVRPLRTTKFDAGIPRSLAYSLATLSDAQLSPFTTTATFSGASPARLKAGRVAARARTARCCRFRRKTEGYHRRNQDTIVAMASDPLQTVRDAFRALGDVQERQSHGEPSWFYRGKRQIAMWADHHHDERLALWCVAGPGVQEALVASEPERYFRPPYVGHCGWIGVDLNAEADWDTVLQLIQDGHALVATKR